MGNVTALEAVIADAAQGVSEYWLRGGIFLLVRCK